MFKESERYVALQNADMERLGAIVMLVIENVQENAREGWSTSMKM